MMGAILNLGLNQKSKCAMRGKYLSPILIPYAIDFKLFLEKMLKILEDLYHGIESFVIGKNLMNIE